MPAAPGTAGLADLEPLPGRATTEETKGIAAVSIQTAISIATFLLAKQALVAIPAGPMLLFRTFGAAVLLALVLAVAHRRERSNPRPGDLAKLAGLGILGVPINQGFFLLGLSYTTPAHAALLFALTPLVVALIGAVRGTERLPRGRIAGIALALAGVLIVLAGPLLRPPDGAGAEAGATLLGDLFILVAVVAWGSYTALARGIVARVGALRATTGALVSGALLYLPLGLWLAWDLDVAAVPAIGWIGLAWLVVMASTIAYLCWYYAIKRLDPSRVAIFVNLQPVGTALAAWAVFGTPIGLTFVVGGVLVLTGVVLAQRAR